MQKSRSVRRKEDEQRTKVGNMKKIKYAGRHKESAEQFGTECAGERKNKFGVC